MYDSDLSAHSKDKCIVISTCLFISESVISTRWHEHTWRKISWYRTLQWKRWSTAFSRRIRGPRTISAHTSCGWHLCTRKSVDSFGSCFLLFQGNSLLLRAPVKWHHTYMHSHFAILKMNLICWIALLTFFPQLFWKGNFLGVISTSSQKPDALPVTNW